VNILAVIQARGGSKGIPKKNIYPLHGFPLIAYTITAARGSDLITDLVVSTDSVEIADVARKFGAQVPFMRPPELAGDKVLSVDSLNHAVKETERLLDKTYDYVLELPCVSPLRDSADIEGALNMLIETGCDSVISMVDTGEKHPIRLKKVTDGQIEDFCSEYPEPAAGSRRQDLKPESYIRNGAIYGMTRKTIIDDYSRHGADSRAFIMPDSRSVNIDSVLDLQMAEFMIGAGRCNNNPGLLKTPKIERFEKADAPRLLITTPLHFLPESRENLIKHFDCIFATGVSKAQVSELAADVDGWICSPCPDYTIDAELLENASSLKVIATTSTGSNHIDKVWCAENQIDVTSLRGTTDLATIRASSEFTFNLVLSCMRKTPYAFGAAKAGYWREVEDRVRGVELAGKTIGIVGFGRIGSNNARYAHAFEMDVVAYDPNVTIEESYVEQVTSYEAVLERADVLLICVHLDESTRGMVDSRWFAQMKDGVYFINTSRGQIIDEAALIENLKSGKVRAAAVDVIMGEFTSNKNEHPLIVHARQYDNLIVTPHIAGLTYDSEGKAANITIARMNEYFSVGA
jgi:D-3-phosphoglycerate dehydrogenase / 2-oxoglutarate reductase